MKCVAKPASLLVLTVLIVLFALPACKYFKTKSREKDEPPIARVHDEYLYYSDVEQVLKSATGTKDSASFVKNYIDDWIKRKLMIEKAQLYLTEDQLDVDHQVEDYRESLILYAYEKGLILEKLDTAVSEEEPLKYFDQYKKNFELDFDLVQMQYVKVPKDAPRIDSLTKWFTSKHETDKIKLEDYCYQYSVEYSLRDSAWFEVPSVLKTIPVTQTQLDGMIGNKAHTTVQDSLFRFALKVNDVKRKDDIAPFEYVKDDIVRLILNKRKMDLIRSTYDQIFKAAQGKNEFEIYSK